MVDMHHRPCWHVTTEASTWNLTHAHKWQSTPRAHGWPHARKCTHTQANKWETTQENEQAASLFFLSVCVYLLPSSLHPQKNGRQAAGLDSHHVRVVSSNRISWERERDDKPFCQSLLKYITHSKWSCWSQTAVDLITPRAHFNNFLPFSPDSFHPVVLGDEQKHGARVVHQWHKIHYQPALLFSNVIFFPTFWLFFRIPRPPVLIYAFAYDL